MKFYIYTSKGKYFWRLKARNGEIIAVGESYETKMGAMHAIALVKSTTQDTPIEVVVS